MIDILITIVHFCAACVSDNNVVPPALGALGGAAGAAGGLGGLNGLSGGGGDGGAGPGGAGGGAGPGNGSANAPPASRPQPIGDSPPSNGPKPIGDQGTVPDPTNPDDMSLGLNPDGGSTYSHGGTRTTTEPGGGPTPIDGNTPNTNGPQPIGDSPPPNGPQPIGDSLPSTGPKPIGDQGTVPDPTNPDDMSLGLNPDGGSTYSHGGTRTTTEPGGGPTPIDGNTPNINGPQPLGDAPPASGPQPIGDSLPSNGPKPIGDQGTMPDPTNPDDMTLGSNPDGGSTYSHGGTRTTTEPGGGPTPIDGNTPNTNGPTNIGPTSSGDGTEPTSNTDPGGNTPPGSDAPAGANLPAAEPAPATADTPPNAAPTSSTHGPLDDRTVDPNAAPGAKAPGDGSFENAPLDSTSPMGPSKFGETTEIDLITPNAPTAPSLGSSGAGSGSGATAVPGGSSSGGIPHKPHH